VLEDGISKYRDLRSFVKQDTYLLIRSQLTVSRSSPSIPCNRWVRPGAAVPAGAELVSIERGIGRRVADTDEGVGGGCESGVPRCPGAPIPAPLLVHPLAHAVLQPFPSISSPSRS